MSGATRWRRLNIFMPVNVPREALPSPEIYLEFESANWESVPGGDKQGTHVSEKAYEKALYQGEEEFHQENNQEKADLKIK